MKLLAWSAPITAVSGELLTAAEYNASVRDNLAECAPNIATQEGSIFQASAPNRIVERQVVSHRVPEEDSIPTQQTSYVEIRNAGPFVTAVTGASALVFVTCEMAGNTNTQCSASFEVSGSTRISASDKWRVVHDAMEKDHFSRYSVARRVELNPGSNTFRMKYRTGGLGPFRFRNREIVVIPL
ncbi:hypothetical protein [Streptomyces sp. CC53]|uniref:hypothetical protein n=1 Tax=Streptomyces sp. CC53 TaxID=1906740 RepID=UPI00115FFAB8|nr:hypothetical protein [Streptomyces sp. CC53]